MKVERYIALSVCILYSVLCTPLQAITPEQEQQFTYYWYAARQAIEQERYSDAFVLLQFCDEIKPYDGQTLYYLGVMYQGMGQHKNAQGAFELAYKAMKGEGRKPKGVVSDELLDRLKMIYINSEQWQKALEMQDEEDQKNGYDGYSAITRYRIYALWGKNKQAIKEIDRYLETDPDNLRFLLFRMELMEQTKAKPKELYAMYQRVLSIDPYNLMVLNNYAYCLATHGGDLSEAERMSAITIREQPDNPVYLDTYGWILHLKGQDELALFYLNRALWNANESTKEEIQKHIKAIQ